MKSKPLNLILLVGCLMSFVAVSQDMPPSQVSVAPIKKQILSPKIELKGNVVSLQNSTISSEVEGKLLDIVKVGTLVKEGQSLATIDTTLLTLSLNRAQAYYASLQADLVFKTSEVDRFSSLAKSDNASKTQLQQAIANRDMLNQQILIAQADIQQAQKALKDSRVLAPFAGIITARHSQKGEYITLGESLVQLVDTKNIEVSVPTPLDYFRLLKEQDLLYVKARGNMFNLSVRSIIEVGDAITRMVEVRLDASTSGLVVGESVSVFAPRAKPEKHMVIPRDALVIRGSESVVYVSDNGVAKQVSVNVVFADNNLMAIKGDIDDKDLVIVRGAERLQPGSPITIN